MAAVLLTASVSLRPITTMRSGLSGAVSASHRCPDPARRKMGSTGSTWQHPTRPVPPSQVSLSPDSELAHAQPRNLRHADALGPPDEAAPGVVAVAAVGLESCASGLSR